MINRAFKGIWIPADIWLNEDLTVMEKLFLVEIDSLDNNEGCYASNAYFAKFFGVSKVRCSQIIKALEAKKLVTIDLEKDGKQIKKRTVRVLNIFNRGMKYTEEGYEEKFKGNNTSINNTYELNKKESTTKTKRFLAPTSQEVGNYFLERGSTNAMVESDKFIDFYTSKNWMVGKNKMKDWKSAVRNWIRRTNENNQRINNQTVKQQIGDALHGSTANDW